MLKHIVFFKFKPETTEADKEKLAELLGGLPEVIPQIQGFVFGRDVIRSERSYDFALDSDFESLETMQVYQVHPRHQEVVQHARSICSDIKAVDFNY